MERKRRTGGGEVVAPVDLACAVPWALALAMSQGVKAQLPQDDGFLMGVLFLQAVAMVFIVAAFRFFKRARTVGATLGRLVLLAIPVVVLFVLWLLSLIAKRGLGG